MIPWTFLLHTSVRYAEGEWFQRVLDRNPQHPFHRVVDHTWERVQEVYRMYGEAGYAEFLVHIALDYGLIPEWNRRYSKKRTGKVRGQ